MAKISKQELELRKWALEMSLKHCGFLFPQRARKLPSEVLSNAHKIVELVTEGWNEPFTTSDLDDSQCPERFP